MRGVLLHFLQVGHDGMPPLCAIAAMANPSLTKLPGTLDLQPEGLLRPGALGWRKQVGRAAIELKWEAFGGECHVTASPVGELPSRGRWVMDLARHLVVLGEAICQQSVEFDLAERIQTIYGLFQPQFGLALAQDCFQAIGESMEVVSIHSTAGF